AASDGEPTKARDEPSPVAPRASSIAPSQPHQSAETSAAEVSLTGTDGARILPFPRPIVTGDHESATIEKPDAGQAPLVTGDYSRKSAPRAKTSGKSKRRPAKPKIPGCEVRIYEAGWNVFRVWYDPKRPGEKWPKKHRAYECYLTQNDVEKGKEIKTNASKKAKRTDD